MFILLIMSKNKRSSLRALRRQLHPVRHL